jgi:2-oxoisovalerate dehydrogenase E2 component (dihydrolipoyl transacylase)
MGTHGSTGDVMTLQTFTLPDLGEGLAEADLIRWLVDAGDTVAVDAPVAEVETAKATIEVPSPFSGVVAQLHGDAGATIAVGSPLISIDDGAGSAEEERTGSGNVLIGYGTTAGSPSRRRRGSRPTGDPATSTPSTPATAARDTTAHRSGSPNRPAVQSPIVRNLARNRGIDLESLVGTGPGGLITRPDVESATPSSDRTAAIAAAPDPQGSALAVGADADRRTGLPVRDRVPIRGVRKAIISTLTRSRAEIPDATTWVDVDATALFDWRTSLSERGEAPGVLAILARFVVAGLARFPELNARVDTDRQEIVLLDGVNLGIAAQTERGLVVPAVRDAHKLGMRGLHAEIKRLTAAAREGSVTAGELTSGSFTLNNYGILGVDGSAAIINHPEVAILGLGRIMPRPWVVDGAIVVRQIAQLSLVFDHRVCDGGTAGGFLRFVADAIENPMSALAEL